MNESRLVFGEQNATATSNDLIIYNDTGVYRDAGLVIGPSDAFANLRISYNSQQAKSHVMTNIFSIDAPSIMMPHIVSATLTTRPYKYVVMDTDGSLLSGYTQYQGDLNQVIAGITNNITVLESALETVVTRLNNLSPGLIPVPTPTPTPSPTPAPLSKEFPMFWIYIIIGVAAFLLILGIVLWVLYSRSSSELSKVKREVNVLKQWMEKSLTLEPVTPLTPVTGLGTETVDTKETIDTKETVVTKPSGRKEVSASKMDSGDFKKKMMDYIIDTL